MTPFKRKMFPERGGNDRKTKTVKGRNRMMRIEVRGMDCRNCNHLVSKIDAFLRCDEDQEDPYSEAHKMGATKQFTCIGSSLSGEV